MNRHGPDIVVVLADGTGGIGGSLVVDFSS
jgi:hypothetical protein